MTNYGLVSAAIFVSILSDPQVASYLAANSSHQHVADLVSLGRHDLVTGTSAPKFGSSFYSNSSDDFFGFNVSQLLATASAHRCKRPGCLPGQGCAASGCTPPRIVAKAIRWLLKYFPAAAQQHAHSVCAASPEEYWRRRLEEAEVEGIRVSRKVCCREVHVTVPLRANGRPAAFLPPVCPVFDSGGLSPICLESRLERHRCDLAVGGLPSRVHGSCVRPSSSGFSLP